MKTLLIWEEVPETTSLYLIDDAPDWLGDCHMHYINGNAQGEILDKLSRVNDALCDTPEYYGNPEDELAGAWSDCKLGENESFVVEEGPVRVVVSGFLM